MAIAKRPRGASITDNVPSDSARSGVSTDQLNLRSKRKEVMSCDPRTDWATRSSRTLKVVTGRTNRSVVRFRHLGGEGEDSYRSCEKSSTMDHVRPLSVRLQ